MSTCRIELMFDEKFGRIEVMELGCMPGTHLRSKEDLEVNVHLPRGQRTVVFLKEQWTTARLPELTFARLTLVRLAFKPNSSVILGALDANDELIPVQATA